LVLAWFVFLVVEDGGVALARLLPVGFAGNCVLASAFGAGCRLVEATTTSRKPKTEKLRPTNSDEIQHLMRLFFANCTQLSNSLRFLNKIEPQKQLVLASRKLVE
jgi:hypothetical protein